jgi:transposase InsO family protein
LVLYPAVSLVSINPAGSHNHPTRDARAFAPASPWQNGFVERLIGSIRRECVDHIIILGEAHLRRILKSYASYYNEIRTHRSLGKDAPISRPVQRAGSLKTLPILGGLHHHYFRA